MIRQRFSQIILNRKLKTVFMKVILAHTAGFCMGVKRALELVLKAIHQNQGAIYTYGPLIHNPQVLELLKERGITVLKRGEVLYRQGGVKWPED